MDQATLATLSEGFMDSARTHFSMFHVVGLTLQLTASAILLALAGCSTAPIADLLDLCSPGQYPAKAKDPHGGVCIPQGGPAGGVLGGPPPVPPPPPPPSPSGVVPVPKVVPGGPTDLPPPLPPPG
jgi:hypothetical protein